MWCVINHEILVISNNDYIPIAQLQFTDVTKPFYSEGVKGSAKLRISKSLQHARKAQSGKRDRFHHFPPFSALQNQLYTAVKRRRVA